MKIIDAGASYKKQ